MSDRALKPRPVTAYARVALRHAQHGWKRVREFAHGLQVAGVATFSVALGLVMYWAVPQAQDLFLEIFGSWLPTTAFWLFFYLMVLAAWVTPVFLSSRWMLARYNKLAYTSIDDDLIPTPQWVAQVLPPLLGALCLVAVLVGQWQAIVGAPQTGFVCETRALKNAPCYDKIKLAGERIKAAIETHREFSPFAVNVFRGAVVGYAAVLGVATLLLLAYLHAAASAALKDRAKPIAIAVIWLGGLGVTGAWLASWIGPVWPKLSSWAALAGASETSFTFFLYAMALTFGTSPLAGLSDAEWPALRRDIIDLSYNHIGPSGLVVLFLFMIATPAAIAGVALLIRRCSGFESAGLRLCSRIVLSYGAVLLLAVLALAVAVAIQLWDRILKDLVDPFSIVIIMTVLPVVSLLLVLACWRLLRHYSLNVQTVALATIWPGGVFGWLLVVASVAMAVFLVVDPVWLTHFIFRAPMLPIVLGIWIPALTFIHALSLRTRVPLLIGFIVVCLVTIPRIFGDPYTIRTLDQAGPPARPTLDESIDRWKRVNECETKAIENNYKVEPASKECPPPIIVLASGGASRAAFKVAEVLGTLANLSDEMQDGRSPPAGLPANNRPFANRLFAISAVSGGALAAVTYQATMAEALLARSGNERPKPPCRKEFGTSGWFGSVAVADKPLDPETGWNSCMELMLAGDFLSPVVVSLMGSDFLNLRPYGDRGATLERAWETRFKALTGKDTLAEPMVALRNRVLAANERNWLPHLVINGTSVSTGRRIITSDLDPMFGYKVTCRDPASGRRWLDDRCASRNTDAYDLHDLILGPRLPPPTPETLTQPQIAEPQPCQGCDLRLSTVATMSARFPLLSPHGTIRGVGGAVVDRVVDGGYFENNGVVAAQELEAGLRQRGLYPHIVLITNEPSDTPLQCQFYDAVPDPPPSPESATLGVLTSPVGALAGTRNSRGALTSLELCRARVKPQEQGKFPDYGSFFHIGVEPDSDLFGKKQLSMSWWLSKHVQRRLTLWPLKDTWEWQALGLAPPSRTSNPL